MWNVRPITASDSEHLWTALKIAANWQSNGLDEMQDVRDHPTMWKYANDWGRKGDAGVVAESGDSIFAGACWFRLFEAGEVWGAIDAKVPVLVFAVAPSERRRGLGSLLLHTALTTARNHGFERLSLSVARENKIAIGMYETAGFETLGDNDNSQDMVVDLSNLRSPNA